MFTEQDLFTLVIGMGIGLLLGLGAISLRRRRVIGRLTFILLTPPLVLTPLSWPLAGALSFGAWMEQLRCASVVVIPLSVAVWLLARVAGWDMEENQQINE